MEYSGKLGNRFLGKGILAGVLTLGLMGCGGGTTDPAPLTPDPAPVPTVEPESVTLSTSATSMPISTALTRSTDHADPRQSVPTAVWLDAGLNGVYVARLEGATNPVWSTAQRIDTSGGSFATVSGDVPASLAQGDAFGNVHVLWTQEDGNDVLRVYAAHLKDGVLQSTVGLDSSATDAGEVRFDLDFSTGRGVATWFRFDDLGGAELVASTFNGTVWSDPHVLSNTAAHNVAASGAALGDKALVVWKEQSGVVVFAEHELGWSGTIESYTPDGVAVNAVVADLQDESGASVIWMEYQPEGYSLRVRNRPASSTTWSETASLATFLGDSDAGRLGYKPAFTHSGGNVSLAWFDVNGSTGEGRLWSVSGSPADGDATATPRLVRSVSGVAATNLSLSGIGNLMLTWAEYANGLLQPGAIYSTMYLIEQGGWATPAQVATGYAPAEMDSGNVRIWAEDGASFPYRTLKAKYGSETWGQ